jgi:hypothetical protein
MVFILNRFVILSAAKNLLCRMQILRYAQDDTGSCRINPICTMQLRFPSFMLAIFLFFSAGCEKAPLPGPIPYPVQGKVIYKGQPAKGFRVAFYPLGEQGKLGFAPSAVTDEKGEFHLSSYAPDDGAPTGEYAVTFQWPQHVNTGEESDPVPEVDQLHGLYNNPQKSRFKITVHEGENAINPFVLK